MKTKLLKIYLPFVIISFGFVGLYTILHWLIIIKLDLIQPKEIIVNFGIPIVISGLLVLFYFRRRIKLLKISEKSLDFYTFISWIIFTIPVIIGQFYLDNQQGKLTKVENPSQIDLKNQTLFYSIDYVLTLNKAGGLWVTRTNADKYGNEIWINCYFACPLVDPVPSTYYNSDKFKTWIGVKFSEKFSNRAFDDKEEQKKKIDKFINSCITKYENYKYQTDYLRNLKYSDNRDDFYSAIERTNIQADKKELLILKEEKGTYETRAGRSHNWLIGTLFSANLIWFLFIFFPQLNTTELRKLGTIKEKEKRRREFKVVLLLFTPSKNYWATPIILDLNILISVIMIVSGVGIIEPQGNELIAWGANFKPLTTDGQWWRLISSVFVHAGLIHLAYNMFALVFIGPFLESSIGSKKFMIIYLLTGIIASLTSLTFHDSTISVGASGAIFGMYGLTASLMLLKYLDKNLTAMLWVSVAIFIGLNLIMGLGGGIDMAAHLGGLISGFIIGITYFPLKKYLNETS
jgi:membrane associated rhomboid family serine protease